MQTGIAQAWSCARVFLELHTGVDHSSSYDLGSFYKTLNYENRGTLHLSSCLVIQRPGAHHRLDGLEQRLGAKQQRIAVFGDACINTACPV